jgi:hypothetical protein
MKDGVFSCHGVSGIGAMSQRRILNVCASFQSLVINEISFGEVANVDSKMHHPTNSILT